jgi:hypothetical protein
VIILAFGTSSSSSSPPPTPIKREESDLQDGESFTSYITVGRCEVADLERETRT